MDSPLDEVLPRIGLGSAPLGGLFDAVDSRDAVRTVQASVAAGYHYIDTAPFYGLGRSERVLGEALGQDTGVLLSTKAGRLIDIGAEPDPDGPFRGVQGAARFDFTRDGIRRSLFESLERLGRDRVDIVFIHDPDDHADQAIAEAYPALEELRDEGLLSWIGIGMNQPQIPTRFVRETDIDAVLLAGRYTLLDNTGLDLIETAADNGVSVIAAGVYNSGILAPTELPPTFDYAPPPAHIIDHARELEKLCRDFEVPLAAAAVQYPLRHPGVATVLVGARSTEEAIDNLAYASTPVPEALWEAIDRTHPPALESTP